MTTNLPALPSARTTVHLSVHSPDALSVTTAPQDLRGAFHLHPCLMRKRSPKSSSPSLPNPSLQRYRAIRECILSILSMGSNNSLSSRRIGTRVRMRWVGERPPSQLRTLSAVTMVLHPRSTITIPILRMDHMPVWWICQSNQKPFLLWDYPSMGWSSSRIILRTVTQTQPRAVCGRPLMQGHSYKIQRRRSHSRTSMTKMRANSCIWMDSRPSERSVG